MTWSHVSCAEVTFLRLQGGVEVRDTGLGNHTQNHGGADIPGPVLLREGNYTALVGLYRTRQDYIPDRLMGSPARSRPHTAVRPLSFLHAEQ